MTKNVIMSKTILIHTIGNRDLQFASSVSTKLSRSILESNPEDPDSLVLIKNNSNRGKNFMDCAVELIGMLENPREDKEEILKHMSFPMLEQVCNYAFHHSESSSLDEVVICATTQIRPFYLDTVKIADLIKGYYEELLINKVPGIKKVTYKYMVLDLSPGASREEIFRYCYDEIFNTYIEEGDQVFISHRQGHPDITFSFMLSGLFQSYHYLVPGEGKVNLEKLDVYEKRISNNLP